MQHKKNINILLQNIISLFFVKGIDLILNLFLIPFLITKVGMRNYGIYAFAMALMYFFVNVLNYGFDISAVRELAIHKTDKVKISEIVSKVISVKLFLAVILYVIVFGFIFFIPRFWDHRLMYFFASLVLVGDLFSLRWFFIGMEKMRFISFMSTITTVIYVLVAINSVKIPSDFIYIPLGEFIGMFLVSVGSFLWVIRFYKVQFKLSSLSEILRYLKFNFSSFINLLLPSTYGVTSVFLVGVFGFPFDVTIMQVGVRFTSAFSTINTILSTVFYPMINRDQKNMKFIRLVLLGVGFCFSGFMYFGNDFLVAHWLQLENHLDFLNIVQLIAILSPIPFLMGVVSSYGVNGLLVFFKDVLYSKITVLSTVVMIIFTFFLVPKYHFMGGGIAFLLGRIIYASLLFLAFYNTKERFDYYQTEEVR